MWELFALVGTKSLVWLEVRVCKAEVLKQGLHFISVLVCSFFPSALAFIALSAVYKWLSN